MNLIICYVSQTEFVEGALFLESIFHPLDLRKRPQWVNLISTIPQFHPRHLYDDDHSDRTRASRVQN